MSIFGSKFQNDLPFKEGEYEAIMLRIDWKYTKAGDPMMIVEFRTDEGRTGKAMFPQVNPFFEDEAKQACKVLLGVTEPEDFETFFMLADHFASRSRFTLVVKNHQKSDGNTTQNFLVRESKRMLRENDEPQSYKVYLREALAQERA
jgi:hypothetical protein